MRVRLSPAQWKDLQVDTSYELVRCSFYLGYKYLSVHKIIQSAPMSEQASIIGTAHILGIKDEDVVVLDNNISYS